MLWDRGAAVSLSPPQGRPSPLPWSPWQPRHLHLPPLGLSTKVNGWLKISLWVLFFHWMSCVLCDFEWTAEFCLALMSVFQLVRDFCNQWPCLEKTHTHTHKHKEWMIKHVGRSRLKSWQRTQQLSVSSIIALKLLSGVCVCFCVWVSLCVSVSVRIGPHVGPHVFFQRSLLMGRLYDKGRLSWDKVGTQIKYPSIILCPSSDREWDVSSCACFLTVVLSWAHTWKAAFPWCSVVL